MNANRIKVFISYAKEDVKQAEEIFAKLTEGGFEPWIDTRNILPGECWEFSISKAIRAAHFVLVLVSSSSTTKRGYLQREIRYALHKVEEMLDSDIFLIPVRLENCVIPDSLCRFQWVDYFGAEAWTNMIKAFQEGLVRRGIGSSDRRKTLSPIVQLRSKPRTIESPNIAKQLLRNKGVVTANWYSKVKEIQGRYEIIESLGTVLVVDYATGLTWQKSGSYIDYYQYQVDEYINDMNKHHYGGFDGWRLPTLEEAISVMEKDRRHELYLDMVFDPHQKWIWTCDRINSTKVWVVDYKYGDCEAMDTNMYAGDGFLRLVRSGT